MVRASGADVNAWMWANTLLGKDQPTSENQATQLSIDINSIYTLTASMRIVSVKIVS